MVLQFPAMRLEFIQTILDDPKPIEIFLGEPNPSIIIDPLDCSDELREYYFNMGYSYLFDIVPL